MKRLRYGKQLEKSSIFCSRSFFFSQKYVQKRTSKDAVKLEFSCNSLLNSLPKDKILDVTKLKRYADWKLNLAKMIIPPFDRVENTVGKGENAGCQHFLLFPKSFPDILSLESSEVGIVWYKVK